MEKVMNNSKLTSVKILEDLYKKFKSATVNTKMTLQKLTNRSINLYLTDDQYKQKLETHDNFLDYMVYCTLIRAVYKINYVENVMVDTPRIVNLIQVHIS